MRLNTDGNANCVKRAHVRLKKERFFCRAYRLRRKADPSIIFACIAAQLLISFFLTHLQSLPLFAKENGRFSQYYTGKSDRRKAAAAQGYVAIAEAAVAEAERLRTQWTKASLLQAVKKYDEARRLWRGLGNREKQSEMLKRMGDVYSILSQNRKALDCYHKALPLSRGDAQRLQIDLLNNIGRIYFELGQAPKTLEYCNQALKLSREIGYSQGEAQATNNIGCSLGDPEKSVDQLNQALAIWKTTDDYRGQAETLTNLGYAYGDLGDIHKAMSYFNEAMSLYLQVKDRLGEAKALSVIGFEHSMLGEMQKALNAHRRAGDFFRMLGDQTGEGRSLNGMGYVYYQLKEFKKSLNSYNQALQLFKASGARRSEAVTVGHLGRIYDAMGNKEKALNYYRRRLTINRPFNDRRVDAYTLKDIGLIYDSSGQKSKALAYYDRALLLNRSARDPRGQACTLDCMGYLYDRSGQKQKALELYKQALVLLRQSEDRSGELLTLNHLARVTRDLGQLVEASEYLKTALALIESLRANIENQELRTSYFASIHSYYQLYVDVLMQMHEQNASAGFDKTALEISERIRARSLLEMLKGARAEISEGADPALLQRERELSQLFGLKSERLAKLLNGAHTEQQLLSSKQEVANIASEYQEVRAELKSTSPRYAALTQPQTLTVSEIQSRLLDPDTIMLEYLLDEDRSYLWMVTPSSIKSYELPGREEIEKVARRLLSLLTDYQLASTGESDPRMSIDQIDAQYQQQANRLSRILLGPVASELENKRLLIVADGVLQYISFPGLPIPDGELNAVPSKPLIVKHEVINIPSASILATLRQQVSDRARPAGSVAIFADPVFEKNDSRIKGNKPLREAQLATRGQQPRALNRVIRGFRSSNDGAFPRLLASRIEAEKIAACDKNGSPLKALDFDASFKTVTTSELNKYRILHFATHGLLDSEHPEMSAIVLSLMDQQGNAQNGFLRLHDIYNLDLPVELVVLSACNTALGKDIKGEGLIGMTRGFMYAGAARVVASLWKVDDDATAELMGRFYQKMLEEGKPPAAALRTAQVEMLERRQWRAPYYWAAFVFQGEWR